MSLGSRLKEARQAKGLSCAELAHRSNRSEMLIRKMEQGVLVNPRRNTVALLCNALEITPEWLLNGEGDSIPDHKNDDFKERVKIAREKKGLTQQQLADRIGCSIGHIRYIETGRRGASDSTIHAIADALEVSASWLKAGVADIKADEMRLIEKYFSDNDEARSSVVRLIMDGFNDWDGVTSGRSE